MVIEVGAHAPVAVPLCEGPIAWTENEQVCFPIAVEVCGDHLCVWPRPGCPADVPDGLVIEVGSHIGRAARRGRGHISVAEDSLNSIPIAVEVCGDHLCVWPRPGCPA